MVTALLACYNESRISEALHAIEDSVLIDKVALVDDGSDRPLDFLKDYSFSKEIISRYHPANKGKSQAIQKGVECLGGQEVVFLIDADIRNINGQVLDQVVEFYLKSPYSMVILARNDFRLFRTNELLSGERILKARYLKEIVNKCQGYNLETKLNDLFLKKSLKIKVIKGRHNNPGKVEKWGVGGFYKNLKMWKQLCQNGYFRQLQKI